MNEIKQACDPETKAACRAGYSQATRDVLSELCHREISGTVDKCPDLQPMACGHPKAYRRSAIDFPSEYGGAQVLAWCDQCINDEAAKLREGTNWCAACEQEAQQQEQARRDQANLELSNQMVQEASDGKL